MAASITFRDFLQNTDIHGVRFVSDLTLSVFRRSFWLLMVMASTVGLFLLLESRIQFYHTYPSVSNSDVDPKTFPIPAVAICPTSSEGPSPTLDEIQSMSDVEVAYTLRFSFKIPIFVKHEVDSGLYTLSSEWMEVFENLNLASDNFVADIEATGATSYTLFADAVDYGDRQQLKEIFERVKRVDKDLVVNPEESYLPYLEKYGSRKKDIFCSATVGDDRRLFNSSVCNAALTTFIYDSGVCSILDVSNFNEQHLKFSGQEKGRSNIMYIYTSFLYPEWVEKSIDLIDRNIGFNLKLYDPDDIPLDMLESVQVDSGMSQETSIATLTINRGYSTLYLDQPHNDIPCSKVRYSRCMVECVAGRMPCKTVPFHDADAARGKRFCDFTEYEKFRYGVTINVTMIESCKSECPRSCESKHFKVLRSDTSTTNRRKKYLYVKLAENTPFEEYYQEAIYGTGDLVAEIGGYIGLFLGASVLTLYHIVEYVGITAGQFLCKEIKGEKQRERKGKGERERKMEIEM